MDSYRGQWVRPPMESRRPHEIVDGRGEPVPLGFFKCKGAATRELHRRQKLYDKRRTGRMSDPRGWHVQLSEGV